jgi:hypothetical protein
VNLASVKNVASYKAFCMGYLQTSSADSAWPYTQEEARFLGFIPHLACTMLGHFTTRA